MRLQTVLWLGVLTLTCVLVGAARAQPQQPPEQKPNRIFGIVLGSDGTRSGFTILDKVGAEQPVRVSQTTAFTNQKGEPSTFDEVVKPGWFVRCAVSAEGAVTEVSARGKATQVLPGQLRALLRVTDEEWSVIGPRIDRIRELQRVVDTRGGGGENGNGGTSPEAAVRSIWGELQSAVWDARSSKSQIQDNLRALRELRARAREDLGRARRELTELLTPRQELLLVMQGVLE